MGWVWYLLSGPRDADKLLNIVSLEVGLAVAVFAGVILGNDVLEPRPPPL